jgi:hypothetical protein
VINSFSQQVPEAQTAHLSSARTSPPMPKPPKEKLTLYLKKKKKKKTP